MDVTEPDVERTDIESNLLTVGEDFHWFEEARTARTARAQELTVESHSI